MPSSYNDDVVKCPECNHSNKKSDCNIYFVGLLLVIQYLLHLDHNGQLLKPCLPLIDKHVL